jgi:hypothetical protein
MPAKTLNQRLVDEMPLRKMATLVMSLLFGMPVLGWIIADFLIIGRRFGYAPSEAQPLFDFLQIPFAESTASLGFVATVLIPGIVGVVCYDVDRSVTPPAIKDNLSIFGYTILGLSLVGLAIGFVSLVIVSVSSPQLLAMMSEKGRSAIQALATATISFYGVYIVQLMGFNAK